jgi:hypothetical protein
MRQAGPHQRDTNDSKNLVGSKSLKVRGTSKPIHAFN